MDKIMIEKVQSLVAWRGVAWRGVAWRGVRACFAYLLAALVVLSQVNITAFAAVDIEYIGSDGNTATISEDQATSIASDTSTWGNGGEQWFVANGDVTINGRVEINGRVHLILKDGSKLIVVGGIHLTGANSLTIYGQSSGTGELIARDVAGGKAGIGGNTNESNSSLTIYGGKITATGGIWGAGIGGGYRGSGGTVTVSGGIVTATGGDGGAGIGGGYEGSGGTVTVSGGIVTATGGDFGAGIGGGIRGNGGTITINGGEITATGTEGGAGIGGGSGISSGTFTTGTNGSAVIYTNSISDKNHQGSWSGVIFEGNNGKVYGSSVTPNTDFEIPSGKTLEIDSGKN